MLPVGIELPPILSLGFASPPFHCPGTCRPRDLHTGRFVEDRWANPTPIAARPDRVVRLDFLSFRTTAGCGLSRRLE